MNTDFVLCGDVEGMTLCSNNEKRADFVLVHESPISKRRELRASKELDESEKMALSVLVSCATEKAADEEDKDEVGAVVAPTPPRRPSFKNGRRVPEPMEPVSKKTETSKDEPTSPTSIFFDGMIDPTNSEKLLGSIGM